MNLPVGCKFWFFRLDTKWTISSHQAMLKVYRRSLWNTERRWDVRCWRNNSRGQSVDQNGKQQRATTKV